MIYPIIATVIFLLITTYLGYKGYKDTKSAQDYMVAGRQIHPLIMALSYGATFISTSAIIGFGGTAGQFGMGLLWLTFLNILVGIFIAFIFFGKRTRKMGHTLDAHTFPELLGKRFNSKFIQGFAGLIIFIFMPIYASSVLKGGVNYIQTQFNIRFEFSLFILVAVVAAYVFVGGLKGVMYTDAFQGSIMFAGMIFLLIFVYVKLGGVVSAHQQLTDLFKDSNVQSQLADAAHNPFANVKNGFRGWTSMPAGGTPVWWTLVSQIVMGVGIGVLAQPQLAVRFMTVKSNKELNRAVLSGGIFILMMTGVAFVVGALSNVIFFKETGKIALLAAKGNDFIIPKFISNYVPSWFGAIFLLTMLAAAMSTLSSQFHTMGTAIGRDVYEKTLGKKGNSIVITKIGILVTILMSTILAWLSNYLNVSDAIIAKGTALFFGLCAASFLPAYIGALYIKSLPAAAAKAGMVAGFVSSAVWIFFVSSGTAKSLQLCNLIFKKTSIAIGSPFPKLALVDAIFVALPISILVTLGVWGFYAMKKKQDLDPQIVARSFEGM